MNDDIDPKDVDEVEDEFGDEPVAGKPPKDDDSLDELADEEDAILPEDEFDDKDLW